MNAITDRIPSHRLDVATRCERILDAAETCFARQGFHRTTMQDIGREIEMSQGNIYRYFRSKEAIVLALGQREGARAGALIARLDATGDPRAAVLGVIREYFVETSRELAVLRVDLWSEVTRNAAIAADTKAAEDAFRSWLTERLRGLATSPSCDPDALVGALQAHLIGLVVQRAVLDDYDRISALAGVEALIDSGLAGRLHARKSR